MFSQNMKDSVIQNTHHHKTNRSKFSSSILPTLPNEENNHKHIFRTRGNKSSELRSYSLGKPLYKSLGGSMIRKKMKNKHMTGSMINNISQISRIKNSDKFKMPSKYGGYFHQYEYVEDPVKKKFAV